MKLVGGNQEFDGFESGEANEFDLGINQELTRDLITNFHSNQNKRPVGIEIHWAFDSLEPWGFVNRLIRHHDSCVFVDPPQTSHGPCSYG